MFHPNGMSALGIKLTIDPKDGFEYGKPQSLGNNLSLSDRFEYFTASVSLSRSSIMADALK